MNEHEILDLLVSTPVKTSTLKKMLVNTGHVTCMRSADRRLRAWLQAGMLRRTSLETKGFKVIYCDYYEAFEIERLNRLRQQGLIFAIEK